MYMSSFPMCLRTTLTIWRMTPFVSLHSMTACDPGSWLAEGLLHIREQDTTSIIWLRDRDWPCHQYKNLQHFQNFDIYSNASIKWEVRWCYKGLSFARQVCHIIVWENGVQVRSGTRYRYAQAEGYCKSSCRFKCQEDLHLHVFHYRLLLLCSRAHLSWELKPLRKGECGPCT